ncbi:Mov34/MPN/PAD-1 family protein [Desulfosporosinus sp. SB140]|uniref:Mov34/MPN/PAD-1 family protein n=1 Tax=Desulfosporosinus paludis TaxID=3115649 RepID=UPI00388E7DC2
MDNTIRYWVRQAHRYAQEHPAIKKVSEIEILENGRYHFAVDFQINLPGKFDLIGETAKGVKKVEPVNFIFPENFPYKAPIIFLRDDFNRDFPHINPANKEVCPCIYDGSLGELLQQPKWFDGILDQVADWLEKAAADNLINEQQGWEPMRSDNCNGLICYNREELIRQLASSNELCNDVRFFQRKNEVFGLTIGLHDELLKEKDVTLARVYGANFNFTCDKYIPNYIENFSDLCELASLLKIEDFREKLNKTVPILKKYDKKIMFLTLAARRPYKIINDTTDIELINFVINVKLHKNKIHLKAGVSSIGHHNFCNTLLLQKFSGLEKTYEKQIVQLGCGSVGSKIAIHLARNGNNNFILVDNSFFGPHNNARYALVEFGFYQEKTKLVKDALNKMGITVSKTYGDVSEVVNQIKTNVLYIDSTASLSVRNLLIQNKLTGPVVNTSLYDNGRLALLAAEAPDRNPRVDDLISLVYSECLIDNTLRTTFLSEQAVYTSTGQGCGSFTTIAPDSRISISTAGVAARVQKYLSNDTPDNGELLLGFVEDDDMGISWKKLNTGKVTIIPARGDNDWEVRLQPKVISEMGMHSIDKAPNETGGALIGCISLINKTITVTNLIPAPEDSLSNEMHFELGTKGLRKEVMSIERKSNGLLTYLGTWHSHPKGGNASSIDKETKAKILVLRNYEPTICLIWTPNGILRV